MKTYVFPGQGIQTIGMGKGILSEYTELLEIADEILGYSIEELCLKGPVEKLNQTKYTQPAIFVVNTMYYLKKISEISQKPDFVCGHSLGEYNALLASGGISFEVGLKLVNERARLMNQYNGGRMLAIIGIKSEEVRKVLNEKNLNNIDIANYNTPMQVVISGSNSDIQSAYDIFYNYKGVILTSILKTSGAFHSHYMEFAKLKYKSFVNKFEYQDIKIPVIANIDALPYKKEYIKYNLINQMTKPVRWTDSILYLLNKDYEMEFEEIGNSNILLNMIKRIKKECSIEI